MTKAISVLFCIASIFPNCARAQFYSVIDLGNFGEDVRISGEEEVLLGSDIVVADFNGDGYGDILAGAYLADHATGSAYILLGAAALRPLIDIRKSSPQGVFIRGDDAFDFTGWAVAAGDVNNDGFQDAIIAADQIFHVVGRGTIYIVYGATELPEKIDLNTDGLPVAGVSRILGKQPQDFAGSGVASGDVNGDGFCDLIIGARGANRVPNSGSTGEVYVFYGSDSLGAIVDLNSERISTIRVNAADQLGGGDVGCFDINQDGYADILIGQSEYSRNRGIAYIVYGDSTLPSTIELRPNPLGVSIVGVTRIIGEQAGDLFGGPFASGDVNGDGRTDLLIGAYQLTLPDGFFEKGKMHVIFGSDFWPETIDLRTYKDKLTIHGARGPENLGRVRGDLLGVEVATGDINHDGLADILTGSLYWKKNDAETGAVFLLQGAADLRSTRNLELNHPEDLSRTVQILGYQHNQELGNAIATGDINGDGIDDIIAGAFSTNTTPGRGGNGEIYIIYGRSKNYQPPEYKKSQVLQSFPNPFNANTVIRYRLDTAQRVRLAIYNARGQEVRRLVDGPMEAGEHRAIWNGYGADFQPVSSGVYFCFLRGEHFAVSQKLLYLK